MYIKFGKVYYNNKSKIDCREFEANITECCVLGLRHEYQVNKANIKISTQFIIIKIKNKKQ